MNGLFPKEELAAERWIVLCKLANDICIEKNIIPDEYYPNQHSKNINEKTLGIALSNYRQGCTQKGTTCPYECVDFIIRQNKFGHWLLFQTDVEKSISKWRRRIDLAKERADSLLIPHGLFYPCQRSESKEEREIAVAINNYRQAMHNKGTHHIYSSVTDLIESSMPHWFTMDSHVKVLLEKWRKKWELIKYICVQKNITHAEFFTHINTANPIEKQIIQSLHIYEKKPRYTEVDTFIRLFHPQFV
jgi:hypothetical protein